MSIGTIASDVKAYVILGWEIPNYFPVICCESFSFSSHTNSRSSVSG